MALLKNFTPEAHRAQIVGLIKIGEFGAKRGDKPGLPRKLEYFRVTTMERDGDGNAIQDTRFHGIPEIGDRPLSLPVSFMYDEPEDNMSGTYLAYQGQQPWCIGDGASGDRRGTGETVNCPCDHFTKRDVLPRCKLVTNLNVHLRGTSRFGGLHRFKSTAPQMYRNFLQAMHSIKEASGGRLRGIPLWLNLHFEKVTDGKQNREVPRVTLEYRGDTDALFRDSEQAAIETAKRGLMIENVTDKAALLLTGDSAMDAAEVPEFYPEKDSETPDTALDVTPKQDAQKADPRTSDQFREITGALDEQFKAGGMEAVSEYWQAQFPAWRQTVPREILTAVAEWKDGLKAQATAPTAGADASSSEPARVAEKQTSDDPNAWAGTGQDEPRKMPGEGKHAALVLFRQALKDAYANGMADAWFAEVGKAMIANEANKSAADKMRELCAHFIGPGWTGN